MAGHPLVLVIVGTRPEAIKLAPVVRRLRADSRLRVSVVATGQHRELLEQALADFAIEPEHRLNVMEPDQTLAGLTSRLLTALDAVIAHERPAAILVQGDTTSALVGAMAGFYRQIPVGHVEAGLRTGDRFAPFPEETNRTLIADLATWHFAPSERHRAALLREGIDPAAILVTGNTIVDALVSMSPDRAGGIASSDPARRLVLVTLHRREHHDTGIAAVCRAMARVADACPDVELLIPVHPNPRVSTVVHALLDGRARIRLTEPLPYSAFLQALARASLVVTDSGGVQEEAGTLGIPTIVTRDATERGEAIERGTAVLAGADEETIVRLALERLAAPTALRTGAAGAMFGDGRASERIVAFLAAALTNP